MARLRIVGVLAGCAIAIACSHHLASTTPDAAVAPDSIDLTGSLQCGTATCGSGQLCVHGETLGSGGSNNPDEHYVCVAAPAGCSLAPCKINSSDPSVRNEPDCPSCLTSFCTFGGAVVNGDFADRTLFCGYPY